MKKPLVIGNWKMYVETHEEAKKIVTGLRRKSRLFTHADVLLAPAFPFLPTVKTALAGSSIKCAAQTVSAHTEPMHTGEVSAKMLKNSGVRAVILGHSERRSAGESNEIIAAQVMNANAYALTSILCVGENERDAAGAHFEVVASQLSSALKNFPKHAVSRLIIAYEPVWAIGKSAGDAMKPADLREMAIFIRKTLANVLDRPAALRVHVLYGGSVEGSHASQLLSEGGVSGFLVGHASAGVDSFVEILKACKK